MARIYQTTSIGEAQLRLAVVGSPGEADLLVHRVHSLGSANGDALWYITRDKQEATVKVIFTSIGMAQVKIHFVDNQGEACWQLRGQQALRYRGQFG